MDLGIAGRTAFITGGAGTIGRAAAQLLQEEGVRVIITDLNQNAVDSALADLGPDARGFAADLSHEDAIGHVRGKVREIAGGHADMLIHAAGVTGAKGEPLDPTEEDWQHALQTDFMSAVRVTKACVPDMIDAGWGRVVYVTSENASQSYPDEVVYNASKAAVLSFASGLSRAYPAKGVLVNCVAPAFIRTNMTDGMMERRAESMGVGFDEAVETFLQDERPYLALKRRGRADEVAAIIALLVSERASFVVGANYRVDGGAVIGMDT